MMNVAASDCQSSRSSTGAELSRSIIRQDHSITACLEPHKNLVPGQRVLKYLAPTSPDAQWPPQAGVSTEYEVDSSILASLWPPKWHVQQYSFCSGMTGQHLALGLMVCICFISSAYPRHYYFLCHCDHTQQHSTSASMLHKLGQLHLSAGMVLQDLPQQIGALLKDCLAVTGMQNAKQHVIRLHGQSGAELIDSLASALEIDMHWLASPLTCVLPAPGFAGTGPEQAMYSIVGDT